MIGWNALSQDKEIIPDSVVFFQSPRLLTRTNHNPNMDK